MVLDFIAWGVSLWKIPIPSECDKSTYLRPSYPSKSILHPVLVSTRENEAVPVENTKKLGSKVCNLYVICM